MLPGAGLRSRRTNPPHSTKTSARPANRETILNTVSPFMERGITPSKSYIGLNREDL
jgi:hypothetical protein